MVVIQCDQLAIKNGESEARNHGVIFSNCGITSISLCMYVLERLIPNCFVDTRPFVEQLFVVDQR